MRHALALLVLRPLLWVMDVLIATCNAAPGWWMHVYSEHRRQSRQAWATYMMVRTGR